jgi:hypothetical protein
MFRFKERPTSRKSGKDSYTLEYSAAGSTDDAFVRAYALAGSPALVSTGDGTLYRQDLQVDWSGREIAYITVPYGPRKKENGQFRLSFDTTGGTLNIKLAKSHVATYPAAGAPNHGGAIGVNGDNVEGAEIVVPALKLTGHFTHPAGIITIPQIKHLARCTGKVNSDSFLTFAAGEILFLGCSGSEGTDSPTEIGYQFACSENLQNTVIGGINVAAKDGWDVAWIQFKDAVDGGKPIKPPAFIHVERVYERIALATALGFGG